MTHKFLLKNMLVALLIFSPAFCFAEQCPNVSEAKNNSALSWHLYDSEEGVPVSLRREAAFKEHVAHFALAEWIPKKNSTSGVIHCYYRDENGSTLEAYLAKNSVFPKHKQQFWYNVSGFMHCAAGAHECKF